jgi:thioredoxin reductase
MSFSEHTVEGMKWDHEVLIIGGGPAGLGAAMALVRLRRSVLVCDDFRPRNLNAAHMHNFPGDEGVSPLEWRKKARQDVEQYDTVHFFDGAVTSVVKIQGGFEATLSSNKAVKVKKVILAYGVQDRLLPIPGIQELWGKSVFHCPFCHGLEFQGRKVGVIANGAKSMHVLPMIFGVTSDITLFTHGKSELTAEQTEILRRRNVRIVEHPVEKLIFDGDNLHGVIAGGELIEQDAIMGGFQMPFQMKSNVGESLGCEKNEMGLYKVGEGNRTNISGVFAAGDGITMQQSVLRALASGQDAGAAAAQDLLSEAFSI